MKRRVIALALTASVFLTCTMMLACAQSTPPPFKPVTNQSELSDISNMLNNTLTSTNATTAAATTSRGAFGLPGFEAVYAVAGLLAVAYLVLRRRK